MGRTPPPKDELFVAFDEFSDVDISGILRSLDPIRSLETILLRDIVLRDEDLTHSWIKWYTGVCEDDAKRGGITAKFAFTVGGPLSELAIFIRYYAVDGGSYMHRICASKLIRGGFACREYVG